MDTATTRGMPRVSGEGGRAYPGFDVCLGVGVEGEPLLDALLFPIFVLGVEGVLQNQPREAAAVGILVGRGKLLAQSHEKGRLSEENGEGEHRPPAIPQQCQ